MATEKRIKIRWAGNVRDGWASVGPRSARLPRPSYKATGDGGPRFTVRRVPQGNYIGGGRCEADVYVLTDHTPGRNPAVGYCESEQEAKSAAEYILGRDATAATA